MAVPLLTICLFLCSLTHIKGQEEISVSGLETQIQETDIIEEKLDLYSRLVDKTFYTIKRKERALRYISEAENLSSDQLSEKSKHIIKYLSSWRHEHLNEFDEKIFLLDECLTYFRARDSSYYIRSLYYLGELYFRTGRFESSQKHLLELKQFLPGVSHPIYSICLRKLSRTYSNLNQNDQALEIISGLISDYEKQDSFQWDGKHMRHFMVKGMFLDRVGRTKEAIVFTEEAMDVAKKKGAKIILNNCKSELARYHLSLGAIEKAKVLAQEALDHYGILNVNYPSMTSTRVTLGNIYQTEGSYKKAMRYYSEAIELAEKHHRLFDHKRARKGMLECGIALGYSREYISNQFSSYVSLQDSLLNENINQTVQDLKIKYESEKKEAAIHELNQEKISARKNLEAARRNNILQSIAILFLLLSGVLLGYLYRNKLKAQRLLEYKNNVIADSLKDKQLLLKEIHHRVKNNLQIVSSLLALQSEYIKDEKVLSALQDGQNRVQSMALIHHNLYQDDDLRLISMPTYFGKLLDGLYNSYQVDPKLIHLDMDVEDVKIDVETVIPIGLITNELVSNVFKYAFTQDEKGILSIKFKQTDSYLLSISDNGKGIATDIVNQEHESFGYQMINAFCQKLGATINVESSNGTKILIEIPINIKTPNNEKNLNSRR